MKFESVLSVATFTHMSSITFVHSVLSVRLAELSFWPLHTSPATLYVKSAQAAKPGHSVLVSPAQVAVK